MTTKAARIMALAAQGRTTRQIACEVNGLSADAPHRALAGAMAYVRTVVNQRQGKGDSPANAKWREANREHYLAQKRAYFTGRYHRDTEWRKQVLARIAARRRALKQQEAHP